MENSLSKFEIIDTNPFLVEASTRLKVFEEFEKQKEKEISSLKNKVTEQIFAKLFEPFDSLSNDKTEIFLRKHLYKLIRESFYFTSRGEVGLVGSKIETLYESISSSDMDPEQFAQSINEKWIDEQTGVSLAEIKFLKKPGQKWEEYEGDNVTGYFKLVAPSRD